VRKESQYSSWPVTLVSDQTDGNSNRIPSPKIRAGTQLAGTFQRLANGLPQVTTLKELQAAKDAAAVKDFAHAEILDAGEFQADIRGNGLRGIRF